MPSGVKNYRMSSNGAPERYVRTGRQSVLWYCHALANRIPKFNLERPARTGTHSIQCFVVRQIEARVPRRLRLRKRFSTATPKKERNRHKPVPPSFHSIPAEAHTEGATKLPRLVPRDRADAFSVFADDRLFQGTPLKMQRRRLCIRRRIAHGKNRHRFEIG